MKLEAGQVAVVTGAASGLGLGLAEAFADRGLAVVLADVEAGALEQAVATVEAHGTPAIGLVTDVRSPDALDALADATLERFGRVDVVCNNAGVVVMSGPTWEVPLEDWAWILGVNLMGVIHGMRSFVPHLVAQNSGHVVNTASMSGLSTGPGQAAYLGSKHAVVAMSHGLKAELAEAAPNVGVTVVCPGIVSTNLFASERNRPAGLGHEGAGTPKVTPAFMEFIRSISQEHSLTPAEAAALVVADIEADKLHSLPNGSSVGPRQWIERILADLPEN